MHSLRGHVELVLLAIIAPRPAHGYAIIERARHLSHGVFTLGEGAVYPVLHKLEREGILRSDWAQVSGRRRRVYRTTRAGRAELARLSADWARVACGMRGVLENAL